ncbi:Peptide deformylase [hydrothermal vent metagenome]|uniref:Peptide deformylase n=1 Tax=hydrothermal vent metagenome TaxID=652676 RepID=A0A1W1EL25_9ZZZZ
MIKDLVVYPDKRIGIVSSDVRAFDEELFELLEDMKDTMNEHKVDGLSAIQIAVPASVIIIRKNDGEYLEIINPRIINHSGKITTAETTLYLPNIIKDISRYESFTMVYQDRYGNDKSMFVDGDLSPLIQRKIDYIYGSSFIHKFNPEGRKDIENELAGKGSKGSFESYDNLSRGEYFTSMASKLLFFEFLTLFAPIFNPSIDTLNNFYMYDKIASILSILLVIIYFAYSKYEAMSKISCTGCQIVSFASRSIKYILITIILFVASYYIVNPN